MMISIIITLLSIDYPHEYNAILGIISLTGAFMAFYEFFSNKTK